MTGEKNHYNYKKLAKVKKDRFLDKVKMIG